MSRLCTCFLPSRHRGFKAVFLAAATTLVGTSGCQSVPRLESPAGAVLNAAAAPTLAGNTATPLLTAVPDFDLSSETDAAAIQAASAFTPSQPSPSPAVGADSTMDQATASAAKAESAGSTAQPTTGVAARPGKNAVEKPAADGTAVVQPGSAAPGISSPRSDATASGSGPSKADTAAASLAAAVSATSTAPPRTNTTAQPVTDASTASAPSASPASATSASAFSLPPTSTPVPAAAQMARVDDASVVDAGIGRMATRKPAVGGGQTNAAATSKPAAPTSLPAYSERRPEAFAWRRTGKSAGGRAFEVSLTGENGFRTLFIGSAVGSDPISMKLMERLARHLHENGLILGGFEAAVIHTLNPDGTASGRPLNDLGHYVNGRFPLQPGQKLTESTPEVDFLLGCIRSFRPQRIVHVRTIEDSSGVIASNERCAETAQLIAESLKFSRLSFPAQSRKGSLEHCLSSQAELDVITLAIPRGVKADGDPWALYGDTLLNLLQPRNDGGKEASRRSPQSDAKTP